jgi:hypothetical protein
VDDIAKAQFRGNTWSAFSVITPRWRAFVDAILRSSAHVICTGRSKTETAQVEDHGKKKVAKLGMKLEARDGLEYEFTTVLDLVHDGHYATVSKDRTGIFSGDPKPISVETGKRLAAWLAGAEAAPQPEPAPATAPAVARARADVHLIRGCIRAATDVKALGKMTTRIDQLVAEDQITGKEWSELTDMVSARCDEIAPPTEAAT